MNSKLGLSTIKMVKYLALSIYGIIILNLTAIISSDESYSGSIPFRNYMIHSMVSLVVTIMILSLYEKSKQFAIYNYNRFVLHANYYERFLILLYVGLIGIFTVSVSAILIFLYIEWVQIYLR
jgi:hypothetical protein